MPLFVTDNAVFYYQVPIKGVDYSRVFSGLASSQDQRTEARTPVKRYSLFATGNTPIAFDTTYLF